MDEAPAKAGPGPPDGGQTGQTDLTRAGAAAVAPIAPAAEVKEEAPPEAPAPPPKPKAPKDEVLDREIKDAESTIRAAGVDGKSVTKAQQQIMIAKSFAKKGDSAKARERIEKALEELK